MGPQMKRTGVLLTNPNSPVGLPHICIILMALACFVTGIFYLASSYADHHSKVEQAYTHSLSNWTNARVDLSKSSFDLRWSVLPEVEGNPVGPSPMVADTHPDVLSEIVAAEHLPSYVNFKYIKQKFPPGSVNGELMVSGYNGGTVPTLSLTISATGPGGRQSEIQAGAVPLLTHKSTHAQTPAPQQKCPSRQGGVYNHESGRCELYTRLALICLQVKLVDGAWASNEGKGCSSTTNWSPTTYVKVTAGVRSRSAGQDVPFDEDWNQISVHLRHADDPFFAVEEATEDSLNFGVESSDMWTMGIVLIVVGLVLSVNPICAIRGTCKEAAQEEIQYEPVGLGDRYDGQEAVDEDGFDIEMTEGP